MKNFDEFQFRPRELVANICHIYVHLGEDDNFCRAVSRDGRSYSHALFEQAEMVLCKIHASADMIASFSELGLKIQVPALLMHDATTTTSDYCYIIYIAVTSLYLGTAAASKFNSTVFKN